MFDEELQDLLRRGLYRRLRPVASPSSNRIVVEGKSCVNLSSNNYLGLADHPRLKDAVIEAVREYGVGTGASPLISGHTRVHEQLAQALGRFKETEAALVFNTGYMANTGTLSAVLSDRDRVYVDRLSHASIIDGCRMAKAPLRVFPHRDAEALARLLKRAPACRRILIVTDGVFSMDGDLAPLPEIVQVAQAHGATVLVDDAHATGVMGANGRGTVEHFGLEGKVDIQMGTMSKALGAFGAYVAGSQQLIAYLINRSRAYIYATAIPAALAAAGLAALDLIRKEPARRAQLWTNRDYYLNGLKALGYHTIQSETPIVPIPIGESDAALRFSEQLLEHGVYAPAIRPPTVPKGMARIRTSVMATHTCEDLDRALKAIEIAGRRLKLR